MKIENVVEEINNRQEGRRFLTHRVKRGKTSVRKGEITIEALSTKTKRRAGELKGEKKENGEEEGKNKP